MARIRPRHHCRDVDKDPLPMIVVQSMPLYEYKMEILVFGVARAAAPATHNPRPRSSFPYVMH